MTKGVMTSPYVLYEAADYQGNVIRITLFFDNTTKVMDHAEVFRDAACLYHKLLIGVGADGSADGTSRVVNVPAGTTTVTAAQLGNFGITTATDFLQFQITAQR